MRIMIRLTGVTGLVFHNERLADPDDSYTRAIKEITDKKNRQTDSDRAEVSRLEWYGGLYHEPDLGVYVPSWNVHKCLERGGSITRRGSTILRAMSVTTDRVPLGYEGGTDLAKLYAQPEFRLRKMVGIQRGRIVRMRPIFRRWSLQVEAEFLEDVMNLEEFARIAELAGRSEGLCDARKLGYGRFTVEVARE